MRRTYRYTAMTKDEAQHSRWTFYEAVNIGNEKHHGTGGTSKKVNIGPRIVNIKPIIPVGLFPGVK